MRNVCSLSGRWCSKYLTQDEYIDKFSSDLIQWLSLAGRERNQRMVFCGVGPTVRQVRLRSQAEATGKGGQVTKAPVTRLTRAEGWRQPKRGTSTESCVQQPGQMGRRNNSTRAEGMTTSFDCDGRSMEECEGEEGRRKREENWSQTIKKGTEPNGPPRPGELLTQRRAVCFRARALLSCLCLFCLSVSLCISSISVSIECFFVSPVCLSETQSSSDSVLA